MARTMVCIVTIGFCAVLSSGCSGETGPLPDLPGKAPALAGSWAQSDPQDSSGCLVIDASGDLVAMRGLSAGQFEGAPTELVLDGQWRTITVDGGTVDYASVGEATLEGTTARLHFSITVRTAGANVATFNNVIEGTYDGTRIVGTATASATSHLPGLPAPPAPESGEVELVLSDC